MGGIYALERIAQDSATDRLTIVEVLATFVRLRSALSPGTDKRQRPPDLAAKLAAAGVWQRQHGCVTGHRTSRRRSRSLGRMPDADQRSRGLLARVDLTGSDLGYSDLAGADLHYSDLSDSFLLGADLRGADLTGVWFVHAMLEGTRLHQADLRTAVLWQARLAGADLRATDLTAADFTGAHLHGARLDLADLRGADFTAADLASATFHGAVADDTTIWPAGFDPQRVGVLPRGYRSAVQTLRAIPRILDIVRSNDIPRCASPNPPERHRHHRAVTDRETISSTDYAMQLD